MKKASVIFSLTVVIALAFILLSTAVPSNGQRNQSSSLDEQALAQARRFFGRMYTKCGEYYYYSYTLSFGEAFLYQCKYAPSVSVKGRTFQPRQLSEADRLNGVDPLPVAWDGLAIINLGLCHHQVYLQKTGPGYSAWGQWSDRNEEFLPLTNKKGQWEFSNKLQGRGGEKVIVPVTCDDVPGENKRTSVKSPYWDGDVLKIPASYDGWFSLGSGPMKLRLTSTYSQIYIDGTNNPRTPLGSAYYVGAQTTAPSNALAPGLKLGAAIVKIGKDGEPFQPFRERDNSMLDGAQINSSEEVFIAINDSYFPDNRGEHAVVIQGRNLSKGQGLPKLRPRPPSSDSNPGSGDTYSIRVFNCDDRCRAFINDNLVVETNYRGDSGWVDVTNMVNANVNKIRFQIINDGEGIAYGLLVRKNGAIVFNETCGTSGVIGCENNRQNFRVGIAREFTYDLTGP